jgi:uncharacterized protein YndB with AHSA1/START domain
MPVSVCPAAIVAAPVEDVWELLAQPATYEEWADAHIERVVPEGPAVEGQEIHAWSRGFGKRWHVHFVIKKIDHTKHQIQFDTFLPLGIVAHNTITCTLIDAASCRVQYG